MKNILTKGMVALLVVAFVLAFAFAIAPLTFGTQTEGTAYADETIEIDTNTKQSSYSSGCVTITVNDPGDGDGAKVDENRLMVISVSGNVVIKNAKVRIGYYYEEAGDVRSDVCDEVNVEGSGNHKTYVTFSNVNAKKITISTPFDMLQIDHVSVELIPVNGVTYELNGGSFNGEYIDYYFDNSGLILPTNVTRTHYSFVGWYESKELTGDSVTEITATDTGNKVFYAKWEPVISNVTFNPNGGEWEVEPADTYTETIGLTLPTNITKAHYTFAGWYSNAEFDGEAVTEITDEDSGDKEYWAKWEHITHNITYHLNGGEWKDGVSAPTLFAEGERFELVGPDCIMPVKTGYMFYGWYTSDTLDEESYIQIIQDNETNDVELWAEWGLAPVAPTIEDVFPTAGKTEHKGDAVTVTATANENGFVLDKTHSIKITFEEGLFPDHAIYLIVADGYEYNPQPEYIESDNQYNEVFITSSWGEVGHGGYSYDGINILSGPTIGAPWPFDFDAFDGSITISISENYSEKSIAFKQIHVIAHHVRTVKYNENDGTMPEEYANKYLESRGLELPIPTRNAYAFLGWYESADFSGDPVTKITVADTGDKVFYAKWEFIEVVDLSKVTGDVVIYDGQTITGELAGNYKVTIADGARVTLKDVVIKGENNTAYAFAGITLAGDATLILEGENTVVGFHQEQPGIFVPENKTLTIGGKGTLDVSSNGSAAGIGAGFDIPCGNIVIEGGTINATGGQGAAGIGAGYGDGNCGDITITGGRVTATGGQGAAGIGGGDGSASGDITITDTVRKVKAVKGQGAPNSIGAGADSTDPVVVTVGGQVYEEGISDADFVYSTATAEEFAELVEALGKVEYTDEYKEKLDEARELYNDLSDEQKARVDAQTLKVLTDSEEEYQDLEDKAIADEATEFIEDLLPNFEDITVEDKDDVQAAREAYEALTDDQKAKVDPEILAKLEAAEKEIVDIETSTEATNTINALPATDEITPDDKEAIAAARKAYDELSDEAKKKVPEETLEKLDAAEITLAVVTFDEEFATVPTSVDQITTENSDAIKAARAAYEQLSEEQKTKFPQEKLERLEQVETALSFATINEELANLPENLDDITLDDKDGIEAAREAYEALSDEEKQQVPQATLDKLEEAESVLEVVIVDDEIEKLPSVDEITLDSKDAIDEAREAYEALSDDQKAKVPAETLDKLEEAEQKYAEVKDADDTQKAGVASDVIEKLPEVKDVTLDDKEAIEEAREAYDALTDDQKAKVPAETLEKLEAAEKEIDDIETSNEAIDTINTLPTVDDITIRNKKAVEEARKEYEALSPEAKEKVPAETLEKLEAAENEIEAIETSSAANRQLYDLPGSNAVVLSDEESIKAAREAYDALSDDAKAKVDPQNLARLEEAEAILAEIKSIKVTDGDVKTYTKEVEAGATDGTDVTVVFDQAAKDNSESKAVEIKAGDTTVVFDANAVQQIAGNDVTFSVSINENPDVDGAVFGIDLELKGSTFQFGKATVSTAFDQKVPVGKKAVVYYVAYDGTLVKMNTWMKDGLLFFETNHFSLYVVKYELTGGSIAGIVIACVIGLALIILLILLLVKLLKKRNKKDDKDDKKDEPKKNDNDEATEDAKNYVCIAGEDEEEAKEPEQADEQAEEQPEEQPEEAPAAEEQPVEESAEEEEPAEEPVEEPAEEPVEEPAEEPAEEPVEEEQPVEEPVEEPKEEPITLKQSMAVAKTATHNTKWGKKAIAVYLEDKHGDEVEINERDNYTSTGLPLADTHYAKDDDTRKCFVYVYETEGAPMLLINSDEELAKELAKRHENVHRSAFPKSKDNWYSLPLDDSYSDEDVQYVLDRCHAHALGRDIEEQELSLKESLALAKNVKAEKSTHNSSKKSICEYLENKYGDEVELNTRANYTSTGLPLADTHYVKGDDGKSRCFVYVYETEGSMMLLVKANHAFAKKLAKDHANVHRSAFPKSKEPWNSIVLDDSFSDDEVHALLDDVIALNK